MLLCAHRECFAGLKTLVGITLANLTQGYQPEADGYDYELGDMDQVWNSR